ncbi:hypothetical protein ACEN2J_16335 [Pseudorhodobacter sp. W20_MBD10_FR17]|uniref:hypothetical protein n=1 Tax=Pseudorhodobacter sp. W20_MBD10_FR17 TaxID=3240266 RepID=UPI003F98A6E8
MLGFSHSLGPLQTFAPADAAKDLIGSVDIQSAELNFRDAEILRMTVTVAWQDLFWYGSALRDGSAD